ncbi:hypothetical protein HDU99_003182 [Rhizoclosmatium hyalinum]|nr:hypothetical protein HDU99_003182 [Rhizoclosmatium hyalinum]
MEDDGFTLVKKKGKSSSSAKPASPQLPTTSKAQSGFTYKQSPKQNAKTAVPSASSIITSIRDIMDAMKRTSFYTQAIKDMNESTKPVSKDCHCICYGIGSIVESVISRHQLAFLLLLAEEYQFSKMEAFDPIFSDLDTSILNELKVKIITDNEQGKRPIESETLFYMPHCGNSMYSNVLGANWLKGKLNLIGIIGNSFSGYACMPRQKLLESQSPYLTRIVPYVTEVSLTKEAYDRADVFNNTSYHTFENTEKLEGDVNAEQFWKPCENVDSQDSEKDPELQ